MFNAYIWAGVKTRDEYISRSYFAPDPEIVDRQTNYKHSDLNNRGKTAKDLKQINLQIGSLIP